jgi:hypothetical protein
MLRQMRSPVPAKAVKMAEAAPLVLKTFVCEKGGGQEQESCSGMLVDLLQLSLETTLLLIARRNEFRENASVTERGLRLSVLLTA